MADDDKKAADQKAADDEQKRIAQAEQDRKARDQAEQDRRKQAREAPLVPNAEGNVMVEAIMGPYRGQRLTMTEADGSAAIGAHWARNPVEALYEHEALSDEDKLAAHTAASDWAKAQWEAAADTDPDEPSQPPPEGGEPRRRGITAGEGAAQGGYTTKTTEPKRR